MPKIKYISRSSTLVNGFAFLFLTACDPIYPVVASNYDSSVKIEVSERNGPELAGNLEPGACISIMHESPDITSIRVIRNGVIIEAYSEIEINDAKQRYGGSGVLVVGNSGLSVEHRSICFKKK